MRTIILLAVVVLLSSCAGGVSNLYTASDQQLFNDLRQPNIAVPFGHHDRIKSELRRRHPEYRWGLIDQGRIAVGMTKAEVMLAKGGFVKVNRASYGEQWVYGFASRGGDRQYVYFENGICTGWN